MDLDLPTGLRHEYFIVDSEDLLGRLFDELQRRQEMPVVQFDNEEQREWFMRDICNLLAFNEQGGALSRDLDRLLKRAEGYLGQSFSPIQRLLWRRFTFELYDRLHSHQLYSDPDNYCTHDYVQMIGHNILMKHYGN